jgi:hypothetical protein
MINKNDIHPQNFSKVILRNLMLSLLSKSGTVINDTDKEKSVVMFGWQSNGEI